MIDKVLLKYFKNLILLLAIIPQVCYMLNKRRIYSAKYKAKAVKKSKKLIRATLRKNLREKLINVVDFRFIVHISYYFLYIYIFKIYNIQACELFHNICLLMVGIPLHPGKGWGCFGMGWVRVWGWGRAAECVFLFNNQTRVIN